MLSFKPAYWYLSQVTDISPSNLDSILCFIQSGISHDVEKGMEPTPIFLPGEFHGQRNLANYDPQGRKELDMTERLSMHASMYSA